MTITLYTAPSCVQCTATKRALDARKIPYDTVDLSQDSDALDRFRSMGHKQAPVVVTPTESWSGYRPDLIAHIS